MRRSFHQGCTTATDHSGLGGCDRGFSLLEIAVTIVLVSIVMGSIHAVILRQHRFYTAQIQIAGARDAAASALGILSSELRDVSPAGDLYTAASDSVAFRSTQGLGVVCAFSGQSLRLWLVSGVFGSSNTDSLLVFVAREIDGHHSGEWRVARIEETRLPAADTCAHGRRSELELVIDRSLEGVIVGSPVRSFRPHVYKLYNARGGRTWLGQRLGAGQLQPVAGPFDTSGSTGLRFEYLTALGDPTEMRSEVRQIAISVRSQSAARIHRQGRVDFYSDSLSTVVYLRNSQPGDWRSLRRTAYP